MSPGKLGLLGEGRWRQAGISPSGPVGSGLQQEVFLSLEDIWQYCDTRLVGITGVEGALGIW